MIKIILYCCWKTNKKQESLISKFITSYLDKLPIKYMPLVWLGLRWSFHFRYQLSPFIDLFSLLSLFFHLSVFACAVSSTWVTKFVIMKQTQIYNKGSTVQKFFSCLNHLKTRCYLDAPSLYRHVLLYNHNKAYKIRMLTLRLIAI